MDPIKCTLWEPTDEFVVSLRRFTYSSKYLCPATVDPAKPDSHGKDGCDASVKIDVFKWDGLFSDEATAKRGKMWGWGGNPVDYDECPYPGVTSLQDHRWPKVCAKCGQEFPASKKTEWQLNLEILLRCATTGTLKPRRELPPGAMYFADWYPPQWAGPDGKSLVVVVPGPHEWLVDGEASNCTRKGDRLHRCWVRHGVAPNITVGKDGETCAAGAGSILVPNFHGFLKEGHLISC